MSGCLRPGGRPEGPLRAAASTIGAKGMRAGARGLLVALVLGLAACAVRPDRPPLPPIAGAPEAHQQAREATLSRQASWSLAGRVAVSNGRDGGSGRIDWQQDGDRYAVALSAPITRQSWRLSGDTAWAELEGLEGGTRSGPDAAALLREATRWDIPVTALASWLRGLRADDGRHGAATLHFGPDGRLARLEQGGWTVDYGGWLADGRAELPLRLDARRGDARVRLVIDQWELGGVP